MLRLSDALANECGKLFFWCNYWGMFEANSQSHITTLAKSLHERSLVGEASARPLPKPIIYTNQTRGDRSWLNARRHQKYKSKQSREEETQPNAVWHVGWPRLRRRRSERLPLRCPN